jgi:hypothetical protein
MAKVEIDTAVRLRGLSPPNRLVFSAHLVQRGQQQYRRRRRAFQPPGDIKPAYLSPSAFKVSMLAGMNREKTPSPKMGVPASAPCVNAGLADAGPRLESPAPTIKPTNIGCVFGRCNLKVGVLPPEAYAALLEEL